MARRMILLDIGSSRYEDAWKLQHKLVELRIASRIPDALILVEHEHVFTIGRHGSEPTLIGCDIPIYKVERGGDITYHGPGQFVGYPIIDLNEQVMDIKRYIKSIEDVIIKALKRFGIKSESIEGRPGVWVSGKKIASIGIAIRDWVTFHGFAINVYPDMRYFQMIKPCGMDPNVMTSMELILGYRPSMDDVKSAVLESFSDVFKVKFESIDLKRLLEEIYKQSI